MRPRPLDAGAAQRTSSTRHAPPNAEETMTQAATSFEARRRAYRTLIVHPYQAAIGAVIEGIDLTKPLSDAQREEIVAALVGHQVIFLRGPILTNAQLAAFARTFGEPQPASESSFGKLAEFPEIDVLAYGGGAVPYVTKELWHTDFSGRETPTMGSVLHCLEAPSSGGDTIWISMFAA